VNDLFHRFRCSVVADPKQPDRFYMDLRVYRIVRAPLNPAEDDPESLLWRGIYLAMEVGQVPPLGRPSRG